MTRHHSLDFEPELRGIPQREFLHSSPSSGLAPPTYPNPMQRPNVQFRAAWRRSLALGATLPTLAIVLPATISISLLAPPAAAQTGGVGAIEGRVLNISTGTYLNNARVTVEGTGRETFTDAFGHFRLSDIPAGVVKLKIFYTGLAQQESTVSVAPGQTAVQDVNLSVNGTEGGDTIQLEPMIIASRKDTDQKAIAI